MQESQRTPVRQIELFIVYQGMYCSAFVFTVIFPYASQLVMEFGMATDRNTTGYWVGLIASSLMLGRVLSSTAWGYILDCWGRKPVTQLAVFSMTILCIAFGIAQSMATAMIVRFLLGLFTPIGISSRIIITELLQGQDISSAMAWFVISWNIGSISGSLFGGILANPPEGFFTQGIFEKYPFLLPNLLPSAICIITLVLGQVYLRETLVKVDQEKYAGRSLWKIAIGPKVFPILFLYLIQSFIGTSFQELITLFAWAKKSSGGLELETKYIGLLLGGSNFALLMFQRRAYVYLVNTIGNPAITKYSLFFLSIFTSLIPLTGLLTNDYIKFSLLPILCIIWYFSEFILCTSLVVQLNTSVHPSELGRITGFSMTLNCIARMIAPTSTGFLFARTINSSLPQPFNTSCSYYLLSCMTLLGLAASKKLEKTSEKSPNPSEIALVEIEE